MSSTTTKPFNQTYEEFVAARKNGLGGSDAASVVSKGTYGCARKLFYDKTDEPKNVDDSENKYFRRGRRLEGIAASYYEEKTGRETWTTTTFKVPGRPHLTVNVDRLVSRKADEAGSKEPGYLELKTVGLFSFKKIQKEGLPLDYVIQVQWGMAVAGVSWGSFGIYCPDEDELLHWDFEADKALGEALLEAGDDFWNINVQCRVMPDPLPEIRAACIYCPWNVTCRGYAPQKERKTKAKKESEE